MQFWQRKKKWWCELEDGGQIQPPKVRFNKESTVRCQFQSKVNDLFKFFAFFWEYNFFVVTRKLLDLESSFFLCFVPFFSSPFFLLILIGKSPVGFLCGISEIKWIVVFILHVSHKINIETITSGLEYSPSMHNYLKSRN